MLVWFVCGQLMDSTDVATAHFLAEQDQRTADLEERLNRHIEELKLATEGTLLANGQPLR